MKRIMFIGLMVILLTSGFASPALAAAVKPAAQPAVVSQTYTVLVGWGDVSKGVNFEAFFPGTLHIHIGDTVTWNLNSKEIHTVSFLAGGPMPDLIIPAPDNSIHSPVMINPQVGFPVVPANKLYDGTSYANSGVMGPDPDQSKSFSLIFTSAGTFEYICLVHGMEMMGKVVVENASVHVPSPAQAAAQGNREISALKRQISSAIDNANKQVKHSVRNADGSVTHFVLAGYSQGQIDLMRFFPKKLEVEVGDTVQWDLPGGSDMLMPHTVTFLNGAADFPLVVPEPQPSGPPLLLLNPGILAPSNPGMPLTRSGVFNSGFMDPANPNAPHSYSLKIGDIQGMISYLCSLHDDSGMVGSLFVEHDK